MRHEEHDDEELEQLERGRVQPKPLLDLNRATRTQ